MSTKVHSRASAKRMSRLEGRRLFARQVKRTLGIRPDLFIERWQTGYYNGTADTPKVMRLGMLIPLAR